MLTLTLTAHVVGAHTSLLFCCSTDMSERKRKRYDEVEKAGHKIVTLLSDCQQCFQSNDDSNDWQQYLAFVDEVVIHGLLKTVACSLGYLIDETDSTITEGVLYEVPQR